VGLAHLFPSHRKLLREAEQRQQDADSARTLARSLESDRTELQAQVRILQKALEESKQRESPVRDEASQASSLKLELDELRDNYGRLVAENVKLEQEIRDLLGEVGMHRNRLFAPPGHFHSPIADPADPFVRQAALGQTEAGGVASLDGRPDLLIDEQAQLRLLGWLGEHGSRFPFQDEPAPEWRYVVNNGLFGRADAALLFAMLLEYKPSRLIDLGCGFSSLLVMDVNDHFLDHNLDTAFFDPRPDGVLSLLTPLDAYRERVQFRRSQDVPAEEFERLRGGDILSLDTSHVAKTGSDVCDVLFRILPALAPGVLVHVQGIYYPFEYPESWVLQDNRSWNEAYMLRAFLQFNTKFRVLCFNDLMLRKYPAQMSATFPGLNDTRAGSLWLERLG
jgi:multidrug efflux pump subunit AcrA (membrane-fusion protein)